MDYAASAPLADEVAETMNEYKEDFYNPSAIYGAGQKAAEVIEDSRKTVADILGAKPAEIVFVSGATEADNLAVGGIAKSYPKGRVAAAATEHKAVLNTAKEYAAEVDIIPVDSNGLVTPAALEKSINKNTVLVSIAMADSELGAVQSFRKLAPVIEAARGARTNKDLPLYFHTDASQGANYMDLHVSRLGVDLMSLGGSKVYGPKSAGVLYAKHNVDIKPLIHGGGQERGLRSGTEDAAAIAGLAKALELAQSLKRSETQRLRQLRDKLAEELATLNKVEINGDKKKQLPNFLNLTINGADGERLVMELDEAGLMAGTGAACTIRSGQPSHVLKAIGLSDIQANGSLRLSLGRQTTARDIDEAAKIITSTISG